MGAAHSAFNHIADAIVTAWNALTGTPQQHNNTNDEIRRREEWEREQSEERERMEREHRGMQAKIKWEAEQKVKEERERIERQQREERERHENEMKKVREENERQEAQRKEERERIERQQMEAKERYDDEIRQAREENERLEAAAKAEREELKRKALERVEGERLRHELEKQRLEEELTARVAAQAAEATRMLQEQEEESRRQREELKRKQVELESKYMAGIQPEVWPTPEERKRAEEQLLQPKEEYFHCAIAGLAGSGKSSLINAFRGLRNSSRDPAVAPTGVTETTLEITAYRDTVTAPPRSRFVWYDVPGAGTSKIKGWQYFNSQGLFVFDLIIVVVDNRFSEQDLIILQHCERYKIPSFIVRSKANQHIVNTMNQDYEWEGSDDERKFDDVYWEARKKVVSQTRANYRENLREGGFDPNKPVYIISCDALAALVHGDIGKARKEHQLIDESQLVLKCLEAVKARRF
ncbi:interferon-inducible GTPase-domain-containing protein [Tirmania nivea]|nr:interferon-inducible GTPase-domain-containing protein [Tirmania nivea]